MKTEDKLSPNSTPNLLMVIMCPPLAAEVHTFYYCLEKAYLQKCFIAYLFEILSCQPIVASYSHTVTGENSTLAQLLGVLTEILNQ